MRALRIGLMVMVLWRPAMGLEWPSLFDELEMTAGGVAAFVVHEGGHAVIGCSLGNCPAWHWTDATWTVHTRTNIIPISMAGFGAEALGSEACTLWVDHARPFCLGFKLHYVINTGQYIVRSLLTEGGHADFSNLSHTDRNLAYGILGAHVAWTVVELLAPDALPAWLQAEGIVVRW